MESLIRKKDWSNTSLGPLEQWPSTLIDTVNLILEIDFPIALGWGKELISIYNDAYRPLLGDRPEALGRPFLEVWTEVRDIIEPQINRALKGEPVFFDKAEFSLIRDSKSKQAWFDYTFSPIRDSNGKIQGIINIAIEVTSRILAQNKLREMNEILDERVKQRTSTLEEYQEQLQTLTFQLNHAKEKERHDIARYLHDQVGQLLDLSIMKLDQLKMAVHQDDILERINDLKDVLLIANENTRDFVHELKPPPIYEKRDIEELLKWFAQKMGKYKLEITVKDDGQPKPLSEETHIILYESVRELCFNIVKHADVGEATVNIRRANNQIQIIVQDAGPGFNFEELKNTLIKDGAFGLFNIQERMQVLGGSLEVESQPGKGTKAILTAPLMDNTVSNPAL